MGTSTEHLQYVLCFKITYEAIDIQLLDVKSNSIPQTHTACNYKTGTRKSLGSQTACDSAEEVERKGEMDLFILRWGFFLWEGLFEQYFGEWISVQEVERKGEMDIFSLRIFFCEKFCLNSTSVSGYLMWWNWGWSIQMCSCCVTWLHFSTRLVWEVGK